MPDHFSARRLDFRILSSSTSFSYNLTSASNGNLSVAHTLDPGSKRNAAVQTFCSPSTCAYVRDASETHSHAKEERIGVLLLNLDGPETLHDVQPFLFNLFADPDIIRLPRPFRFLQRPLAKMISVLRAPKSKEGYAAIGRGSSLRRLTDEQAHALKMALEGKLFSASVYVGMRYWYPFTEEAVEQMDPGPIDSSVLPLQKNHR